jgi:GT2 family glycosyltransferase
MRTSVLIGAHNEGSRLWHTVESILESGMGKDAEVVVADDASTDGSSAELRRRFPQIVVVDQRERSGVAATRGLAVRQARGETLVFLDGHTKPGRGAIDRLVSSVERTSGKAIVTPRIEGLDDKTWKSLPQQLGSGYALDLETFDSWWLSDKKMKEVKVGGQTFFESPALVGCSLAVSRELYDKLWGFDVHMRQYGVEDLDFALKAWLMGARVLHDPEATIAHRFQHLFNDYEVGAEYPLANQIRSARKNFTQTVWEEWVERARENNRKRLAGHPEGLWARAWEIFQQDRVSAEHERAYLMSHRIRDEFWYAKRFERSWPAMGGVGGALSQLSKPNLLRSQRTLLAEAKPSKEPKPCTCSGTGTRYYAQVVYDVANIVGALATIKTRYGKLCCEGHSTKEAYQVAYANVGNFSNPHAPGWAQTGWGEERLDGSPLIKKYRYAEMNPLPGSGTQYWVYYDHNHFPDQETHHRYEVNLDNSIGRWTYHDNNNSWASHTDVSWVGKTGTEVSWTGETWNKEDDMPGTEADPCTFTDCQIRIAGQKFKDAELKAEYIDITDPTQAAAQVTDATSAEIWDINPG